MNSRLHEYQIHLEHSFWESWKRSKASFLPEILVASIYMVFLFRWGGGGRIVWKKDRRGAMRLIKERRNIDFQQEEEGMSWKL